MTFCIRKLEVQSFKIQLFISLYPLKVILLTYGPPKENTESYQMFNELFQIWYPSQGQEPPRAFSTDSTEELDLIPDWLKLRMIRSEVKNRSISD
jgi:hypothetical protein